MEAVTRASTALSAWFALHRRDLPWRVDLPAESGGFSVSEAAETDSQARPALRRDPYATWISEIMLQQTQVSTVIDYFNRWMRRFPDVGALAAAREEEVLEAWAGLGYYSRARNLLITARLVVERFGGRFPWRREDLMGLKGIGEYTAGAIASLAFNRPEPILDGNLVRVFSRLYGLDFLPDSRSGKSVYWDRARAWVESHDPAAVNEGLMELGATVCTPKNPDCGACPLAFACTALAAGSQNRLPPAKPRKDALDITGFVVVAIRGADASGGGEALLYRPRKPELLAGLLTFPVFTVPDLPSLQTAWKRLLPGMNAASFRPRPITISHSITHHRIRLRAVSAVFPAHGPIAAEASVAALPEGFLWAPVAELDRLLVSSLPRKIWKASKAVSPGSTLAGH